MSGLLFLYRYVLKRQIGDLGELIRARQPTRLPALMTRDEVKAVLAHLEDDQRLMASLMHGAGLRLTECLHLRVQDIDFQVNQITVRDGKGGKDRVTMLPEVATEPLRSHLQRVTMVHQQDLADGYGRVQLPDSLTRPRKCRTYPSASAAWRWQWVFPQERRWASRQTGDQGRPHVPESIVQKAVRHAVQRAGMIKRATCHAFRHSFATHLLEDGYDVRTLPELLGHKDVKTTMVYTHVLNRGGKGVKSPLTLSEPNQRGDMKKLNRA